MIVATSGSNVVSLARAFSGRHSEIEEGTHRSDTLFTVSYVNHAEVIVTDPSSHVLWSIAHREFCRTFIYQDFVRNGLSDACRW